MKPRHIQRGTMIAVLALALAACGGTTAALPTPLPAPTSAPQVTAAPTSAPQPTSAPTNEPAATAQAVTQPAPTSASATQTPELPMSQGQVVLQLAPGSGPQQVGISDDGPRSFRIGGDGTIRVLDNANKRVLIFGQNGERGRVLPIPEASDPMDFIINTKAEVYVLDGVAAQVLHYGKDNVLLERIPINQDVANAADGVMLSSDQDVYLVQNNSTYWALVYKGKIIAPELQRLTLHNGTISPRSPRTFHTEQQDAATQRLMVNLPSGETLDSRTVALPQSARFLNIDREMNLYFYDFFDAQSQTHVGEINIWRVQASSEQGSAATILGGVHLQSNCDSLSWRTFYMDQAGAAWTMCASKQGATFVRYNLLDAAGNALPEASLEAVAVTWQPGSKADLVKG